jgi:nicotinamidase-related amidase
MDHQLLLKNVVSTVKTAKAFGLPIVHSTISVASGRQKTTVPERAAVLEGNAPLERTSINSWEDVDFGAAVRSTGRRKLIFCALWTEVCMAFLALDALAKASRCIPSSTRSVIRPSKRIAPDWNVSLLPEDNR